MEGLLNEIIVLKEEGGISSKNDLLVNGVINAIDKNILEKGDRLPSINKMVEGVGYARKTIVRAYEELKNRGLVESKNFKGYYIASTNTKSKLKVALLLYAFRSFQEDFYNVLRQELGKEHQIDIFFHHNNIEVFANVIENIKGKYGMYVVAPIPGKESVKLLSNFPEDKLLTVDRYLDLGDTYSFVSQEFELSTYNHLVSLSDSIKNFDEVVLFYRGDRDYPEGIKKAFHKFKKDYDIKGTVTKKYLPGSVKKNTLYLFISDSSLGMLLKDCNTKGFEVGKDVGVLTHNDTDLKEIIFGGITTFSVDFKQMAIDAAEFVKNRTLIRKILPSEIKKRNSL